MLALKQDYPLPDVPVLDDTFSLTTDTSKMHCTKIEEFDEYAEKTPYWGMPYAFPGLTQAEHSVMKNWIANGAQFGPQQTLNEEQVKWMAEWEGRLNQRDNKSRLVNRYLYEHLFVANLYDERYPEQFYNLIRSSTPPGEPAEVIATRRPYDDPEVDDVFYRLVPRYQTVVYKSHMPYVLNDERAALWDRLFYNKAYKVDELPGYELPNTSNPFETFKQLPVDSRYKFLLYEAQFSIMNFIKSSVCRGQVAVSVINDHFWVVFLDPDAPAVLDYDAVGD